MIVRNCLHILSPPDLARPTCFPYAHTLSSIISSCEIASFINYGFPAAISLCLLLHGWNSLPSRNPPLPSVLVIASWSLPSPSPVRPILPLVFFLHNHYLLKILARSPFDVSGQNNIDWHGLSCTMMLWFSFLRC